MHNWDELNESGQCTAEADYAMVKDVCSQSGIPCKRANFVKEYWNDVFRYASDRLLYVDFPDLSLNLEVDPREVFHLKSL